MFMFAYQQKFRFFCCILTVASISFSFCPMTRPSSFLDMMIYFISNLSNSGFVNGKSPAIPKNALRLTPRISPAAPPISEKNCVDSYSICSTWSDLCSGLTAILLNKIDSISYFQKYHNACKHFRIVLLIIVYFIFPISSSSNLYFLTYAIIPNKLWPII